MILFIIFVFITISFLVLAILDILIWETEALSKLCAVFCGISLVCCITLGVIASDINNNRSKEKVRSNLQEREKNFQLRSLALTEMENSYLKYALIEEYNKDVKAYKEEIVTAQDKLNNPWINWYTCSAYKEFDSEAVSYFKIYANEWTEKV